jgi:DNA replication protein DnaC
MRYLTYDVPVWDSRFSQITPCPVCSKDLQSEWLRRMCGLNEEDQQKWLANTKRTADNAAAFDGAKAVIAEPAWFYTLHGPHGTGKSHLLAMIVNECRTRGWISLYTTTAEVMDHLRAAYAPGAPYAIDEMWERLTTARVLMLDEFDRWNPTPWAQEKFFELVDIRYRNGAHCLTGFATNAGLDTVAEYVHSRMEDRRCQIHQVSGPDLRRVRK